MEDDDRLGAGEKWVHAPTTPGQNAVARHSSSGGIRVNSMGTPRRYGSLAAPEPDDADPDDGGQNETGTVFGTTFNTITNVIGGGVLALPDAMYQSSIGVGVILCVFSSIASTFAVYVLVHACEYYERFSMMDVWSHALYPPAPTDVVMAAVYRKEDNIINNREEPELDAFFESEERKARWRVWMSDFMIVLIFLYNFGCLVLYGVVIGDSLPPVVQNFFHGSGIWIDKGTWLIVGGVAFFALTCVRKMSELMWSSILGFVTILYVIILVAVRYFTFKANPEDMPTFNQDVTEVKYFEFGEGVATSMTAFALAYCYHYNVPYYYKELKERTPEKYLKTSIFSQPVTFVSYVATGVLGYLTFGAAVDNAHSGGNIVHNYADDDVAVNIGRFGLFFHFVCVYPILAVSCRRGLHHVVEQHILRPMRKDQRRKAERVQGMTPQSAFQSVRVSVLETPLINEDPKLFVIIIEAFSIVSLSIICAWVAPGIKIVVNITGSLFGLFLMLIAPGLIGVKMFKARARNIEGIYNPASEMRKYWFSWALVVSGVIFTVVSFYTIVA
ncbi:amino acid transporter, putative [Bodo saltans]|uniref:Amino acid transporter, putative n=1 Tax=Bodo saltans TaxID=75058 RepID=A0A0S4JAL8_BODSA|nr:amino acid transporter, putative [Bodo saltans]|eukprot:CUG86176.1 amino acid transporter, putative [Bodo saltans]